MKKNDKEHNYNPEFATGSYILPIVRNAEGYLVESNGMFVAPDDRRISHVSKDELNRTGDKSDTMKKIISRYKEVRNALKVEQNKEHKDETKINRINKVVNDLELCLLNNQEYINKHLKLDVAKIISNRIK